MKDTHAPRLLVIDDDRDVRDAVVESLVDEGYGAREAENGAKALALLRDGSPLPCVILLDMMMPVMDGPTFRAAQLGDPRLREIPVVIMSASARIETAVTDLAASGFLRKPLQLDDLLAVAARFCDAEA